MTRPARLVAIAATAALAVAGLAWVAPAQASTSAIAGAAVIKTLPATVRLAPGESVKVRLSTNLTTGYSWSAKVSGDKSAITVSKGVYTAPTSTGAGSLVGAPGKTTWTITAKSGGTAKVTFLATPPGGGKPDNDGVVTVIVK